MMHGNYKECQPAMNSMNQPTKIGFPKIIFEGIVAKLFLFLTWVFFLTILVSKVLSDRLPNKPSKANTACGESTNTPYRPSSLLASLLSDGRFKKGEHTIVNRFQTRFPSCLLVLQQLGESIASKIFPPTNVSHTYPRFCNHNIND